MEKKVCRRDKGFTTRADKGSEQHCSCMKWSGKASEQFSQPNQAPKEGAGSMQLTKENLYGIRRFE